MSGRHRLRRPIAAIGAAALSIGVLMGPGAAGAAAIVQPCVVTWEGLGFDYSSLQSAVTAAAPETTLRISGICTGTTSIGKSLTLKGMQPDRAATLDGVGGGAVLWVTGGNVKVMNLTITGGTGFGGTPSFGGNLYVFNGGTVDLVNATVRGGQAMLGGGLAVMEGSQVRLLGRTLVTQGQAAGGGNVYVGVSGTFIAAGRSRITAGRAQYNGGGISVYQGSVQVIGRAQVTGNKTVNYGGDFEGGGGIYASQASVLIGGTARITGNRSWAGGAVLARLGTTLTIAGRAVLSGNKADVVPTDTSPTGGGGIYANSATVRITDNAVITANRAPIAGSGGGIRLLNGATIEHDGNPATCATKALRVHLYDNLKENCVSA